MREVKFKVFVKWAKLTLRVHSIDFERERIYCHNDHGISNPCDFYNFEDCVLMQSTGLKDINGIEIYEGYIVGVGNYVYEVIIDMLGGLFFRCIEHLSLRGGDNYYSDFVENVEIEVIGNIYESKELK